MRGICGGLWDRQDWYEIPKDSINKWNSAKGSIETGKLGDLRWDESSSQVVSFHILYLCPSLSPLSVPTQANLLLLCPYPQSLFPLAPREHRLVRSIKSLWLSILKEGTVVHSLIHIFNPLFSPPLLPRLTPLLHLLLMLPPILSP